MFRLQWKNCKRSFKNYRNYSNKKGEDQKVPVIPKETDVVIIGGGSAGCYTLYHLAKLGVRAILLERFKLTAGTTWHTNGLMWRIRPNDVDIQLLNRTRDTVLDIKENTEYDPGWIQNGGIFIARNKLRLDEYQRLATLAKVYGIEHSMLTRDETLKLVPFLNGGVFVGSLYSPGDGIIDPTMLCNALTKLALQTSNAQVIENCPVQKILTEQNERGVPKIVGLRTEYGDIKTKCVVNATGAWGRDLIEPLGITLPLIPMKHSYVMSEPIKGVQGAPNLRDHDASIAIRVQGSSFGLGGYEKNPIILDKVDDDFSFSLYDLDWSTFDCHVNEAVELCPAFGEAGIKCTICGPETFTPDHKPIMGPDPRLIGLFHNCGYNSAGMMFGGGCGEQLAQWIINGRPEFYMHNFDVRRFTDKQMTNKSYCIERCHEAYAENYSLVFDNAQPLAGRNFQISPLHQEIIQNGAIMEVKQGYERPAYFYKDKAPILIPPYDWYGAYDHTPNSDTKYTQIVSGDQTYGFSEHHQQIGAEAINCRKAAAVFDLSSYCKILIDGPDASKALEWICTNDIDQSPNSLIYSCTLNNRGGVEAQFTVNILEPGNEAVINAKFQGNAYYIVADGAYGNHTLAHINEAVDEKKFNVNVTDLTDKIGIISIQGPNSQKIMEELSEMNLSNDTIPDHASITSTLIDNNSKEKVKARIMRVSYVGELGYELHLEARHCVTVYKKLMKIGVKYGLKNAGFRALNSLSCENGNHLWGYDVRSDDTPIEANLEWVCRKHGVYKGSDVIEKQRVNGVRRRLVHLTLDAGVPIWGFEGVYCNGNAIGYLRRADFGHSINKSIGKSFICINGDEKQFDVKSIYKKKFEIDVLGQLHPAEVHLHSPLKAHKH